MNRDTHRKLLRFLGLPSEAVLDRISRRMWREGCDCCGARFGNGMPAIIGRAPTGWAGRCMFCSGDLEPGKITFDIHFGEEPWSRSDRLWFRANPGRNWRLRRPIAGEVETLALDERLAAQAGVNVRDDARQALCHATEGGAVAIAVHQYEPGRRARIPIRWISEGLPESFTDAGIAALRPSLVEIAAQNAEQWTAEFHEEAVLRRFEAGDEILVPLMEVEE